MGRRPYRRAKRSLRTPRMSPGTPRRPCAYGASATGKAPGSIPVGVFVPVVVCRGLPRIADAPSSIAVHLIRQRGFAQGEGCAGLPHCCSTNPRPTPFRTRVSPQARCSRRIRSCRGHAGGLCGRFANATGVDCCQQGAAFRLTDRRRTSSVESPTTDPYFVVDRGGRRTGLPKSAGGLACPAQLPLGAP